MEGKEGPISCIPVSYSVFLCIPFNLVSIPYYCNSVNLDATVQRVWVVLEVKSSDCSRPTASERGAKGLGG